MKKVMVSPSILSANFLNLEKDINEVILANCEYIHFDVMDGHFVKNISFGIPILKQISESSLNIKKDVHLMISNPKKFYKEFIDCGADILTIHYEAFKKDEDVFEIIKLIKNENIKIGISIKPKTNVEKIKKFIPFIDLILIMSVEPGFGGQSFIYDSLNKIKALKVLKDQLNENLIIEIDGGINNETAKLAIKNGANMLVAGSYIFNSEDIQERIRRLENAR